MSVWMLGCIGHSTAGVVEPPQLISAHTGEDRLGAHANDAIWRITGGEAGIEALIKELQDGSEHARSSAPGGLSLMGSGAAAVAVLAEVLRRDPSDRLATAMDPGRPSRAAAEAMACSGAPDVIGRRAQSAAVSRQDGADRARRG